MEFVLKCKKQREDSMTLIPLSDKARVTIPKEVRQALGLSAGDLLELRIEGGSIVLTPQKVTEGENQRSDEVDIKALVQEGLDAYQAGDVTPAFDNVEELLKHLDAS